MDNVDGNEILLFESKLEIHNEENGGLINSVGSYEDFSGTFYLNSKNEIIMQDGKLIRHLNLKGELIKQTKLMGENIDKSVNGIVVYDDEKFYFFD